MAPNVILFSNFSPPGTYPNISPSYMSSAIPATMAFSPDHYYHQPSSPTYAQHSNNSQNLRHSKTDPSLSSNLNPLYPSDTALKTISTNHYGSTRALNQHHYAEMRHYHSPHHHHFCGHQISSTGNYYGMPPASCNDASNNKLVHRHHYQNTAVHPYMMQPYCACYPSGSQLMSPTSTSTSIRNRMFSQQVTFEAPELSEETILDKAHHETLAKLNFVLALVDSLLEFINSSSPLSVLSESVSSEVCF